MFLDQVTIHSSRFPNRDTYPFNLKVLQETCRLGFSKPITFFVGENGSGKSTLLTAITRKCGIHIWRGRDGRRVDDNPYEDEFYRFIDISWVNGPVPGSFFASQMFQNFSKVLDEWAAADPGLLDYFGGQSLMTQSHGQSILSFFESRFRVRGIYFLDEPETALSPRSQIELLNLLRRMARAGHAQFLVASHSPILLACPDADIVTLDTVPAGAIAYEDTEYYRIYKGFLENREQFIHPAGHTASERRG